MYLPYNPCYRPGIFGFWVGGVGLKEYYTFFYSNAKLTNMQHDSQFFHWYTAFTSSSRWRIPYGDFKYLSGIFKQLQSMERINVGKN